MIVAFLKKWLGLNIVSCRNIAMLKYQGLNMAMFQYCKVTKRICVDIAILEYIRFIKNGGRVSRVK